MRDEANFVVGPTAAGDGNEPVAAQSLLGWVLESLGWVYLILLLLVTLISLTLLVVILVRGHGAFTAAAIVLLVHAPFLLGLFGAVSGAISSYRLIATSGSTPHPSDLAAGISTALVALLVGMLLTAPLYPVAILGALIRGFKPPVA
ncbi:MotA/TolQ/ExbB proton channel family protein [Roseimaritima sediminicola]|uniref:MotA/TolQ/ExbB proton channel family protein n=1 Tax=Roseimaritima sediminicola TaxID=2662066 RepID=UPI001F46E2D3|nr:MotA/TolQ/ExbB proton channel family protein [Roseimaritima sediminicola]